MPTTLARLGLGSRHLPPVEDPPAYPAVRDRVVADYRALPADAPVRLAKSTSNLFRARAAQPGGSLLSRLPGRRPAARPGLDVSGLSGVLSVDLAGRTAEVLAMTTYEDLVDALLPHGVMPLVVPQLKTITIGGAVTGLGIESSSFRNGLPHESVREIDILTGDGRVVTATATGPHADLYHGFPNSYGTLGYALRLVIDVQPVQPFVALRHRRFDDLDTYFVAMARACEDTGSGGHDFVDGMVVSPAEAYLTTGDMVAEAPAPPSDYTGMDVYYRSVMQRTEDVLTIRDYLWRWDTDWFWCSRAFGAQNAAVRRLWPKRWLRSDVYWKIIALEGRYGVAARVDRLRGRPAREKVVQDVEVEADRAAQFVSFLLADTGISPVWACPLRLRAPDDVWSLYPMKPATTYVNVGFWSSVALADGEPDGTHNRRIEAEVDRLDGRKSLYSTSYYPPETFWRHYNGLVYRDLKAAYDPDSRLLDLYDKCVRNR